DRSSRVTSVWREHYPSIKRATRFVTKIFREQRSSPASAPERVEEPANLVVNLVLSRNRFGDFGPEQLTVALSQAMDRLADGRGRHPHIGRGLFVRRVGVFAGQERLNGVELFGFPFVGEF